MGNVIKLFYILTSGFATTHVVTGALLHSNNETLLVLQYFMHFENNIKIL
jgi:hypothetical protein